MKRAALLAIGVALAVALSKLLIDDVLRVPLAPAIRSALDRPGPAAAAVLVGALAIDLLLPIPSSLVMVLSGALFGVPVGALLSLVGSLAGNLIGFEVCRRYGRSAAARFVGEADLERVGRAFARGGALAVLVTRPLPIVMETMTVVAGLSTMTRKSFLLASIAGTAPIALVYAYAGAASRDAGNLTPAIVILVAVLGAGWILARGRLAPARTH